MNDSPGPGINARLTVLRILLVVAFAALLGQLWRLQMVQGDYYRQAADVNRFRLERNPAPRGVMYDRRGHLLVRNAPEITVSVIPAYLPEDEAERQDLLLRLGDLIGMPMTSPPIDDLAKGRTERALESDPDLERGILESGQSEQ